MNKIKKDIQIDLNELIGKVYFKIASWHNEAEDPETMQRHLKITSEEIIIEILDSVFDEINLKTRIEYLPDEKKESKSFIKKIFKK